MTQDGEQRRALAAIVNEYLSTVVFSPTGALTLQVADDLGINVMQRSGS